MTVSPQFGLTPTTTAPPPLGGLFDRLAPRLHRFGMVLLRGGLGGVFVWFGILKVIGLSPAAQLVVDVMPFPTGNWFVPALGCAEVALGLWLVSGKAQGLLLPVLGGHLLGTFAVLLLTPQAAFDHSNPLLLTMVGEFVVKNVVLLAAAVVVTTRPKAGPVASREPRRRRVNGGSAGPVTVVTVNGAGNRRPDTGRGVRSG